MTTDKITKYSNDFRKTSPIIVMLFKRIQIKVLMIVPKRVIIKLKIKMFKFNKNLINKLNHLMKYQKNRSFKNYEIDQNKEKMRFRNKNNSYKIITKT